MKGKYAVIFTGGSYDSHETSAEYYINLVKNSSFFICADSGANYAYKFQLKPSYIVGDMDSIDQSVLDYFDDVKENAIAREFILDTVRKDINKLKNSFVEIKDNFRKGRK